MTIRGWCRIQAEHNVARLALMGVETPDSVRFDNMYVDLRARDLLNTSAFIFTMRYRYRPEKRCPNDAKGDIKKDMQQYRSVRYWRTF